MTRIMFCIKKFKVCGDTYAVKIFRVYKKKTSLIGGHAIFLSLILEVHAYVPPKTSVADLQGIQVRTDTYMYVFISFVLTGIIYYHSTKSVIAHINLLSLFYIVTYIQSPHPSNV